MWKCLYGSWIASAFVLLTTLRSVTAAATDARLNPPDLVPAVEASQLQALKFNNDSPNFDLYDNMDRPMFFVSASPPSSTASLSSMQFVRERPVHPFIEQAWLTESRLNRPGEFMVPIPAIGAGWMLLMGVGMYKVGCRVLRVKN